jgi:hypothetical protein
MLMPGTTGGAKVAARSFDAVIPFEGGQRDPIEPTTSAAPSSASSARLAPIRGGVRLHAQTSSLDVADYLTIVGAPEQLKVDSLERPSAGKRWRLQTCGGVLRVLLSVPSDVNGPRARHPDGR